VRTLENGVLTLDGLTSPGGEYDFLYAQPSAGIQLAPGEVFVAEWRLRVGEIEGYPWDPEIVFVANDRWGVSFTFSTDRLRGGYEINWLVLFTSGQWHSFSFWSDDLRTYTLAMDGEVVRNGVWKLAFAGPWAAWGDSGAQDSSSCEWDYVRVGIIPETGGSLILALCAVLGTRRPRV
jgi:hypothetical protein